MNLDIGGRSTDIVVSILKTSGIKTIKSETGGFFACTLELDMSTGSTNINPPWEDAYTSNGDFTAPSMDDILSTIQTRSFSSLAFPGV